jgi:S1-C subfamily serine protease
MNQDPLNREFEEERSEDAENEEIVVDGDAPSENKDTEEAVIGDSEENVECEQGLDDEYQPFDDVYTEALTTPYGCYESHGARKKRTALIISVTAVYALAAGIIIGILLSFLYSGGKSAVYKPIGINTAVSDTETVGGAAREGIAKARDSVVVINVTTLNAKAVATGIVLSEDGYIATNEHVVDGAISITVTFLDGVSVSAELCGVSEADDLAVIKVEREGLVPAEFASTESCYVGQDIYVIGTPIGTEFKWTTTKGIISCIDRELKIYDDYGTLEKKLRLLQTDALLNPGNSGGPMINSAGQVLGIINMKITSDTARIGFAIPSDGALEIINAIIRDGNADSVNSSISSKRPLLGIVGVYIQKGLYYVEVVDDDQTYIRVAGPEEVEALKDELIYSEHSGLYVNSVTENTGSYGKLQAGDVIVEIEGEEVTSRAQITAITNDKNVGDTVNIKFYRDGVLCSADIELTAEK